MLAFFKKYGSIIGFMVTVGGTVIGFTVKFYIKSEITFEKVEELEKRVKKIEKKVK